ncbi:MAG: hypothetical protein Q8Q23_04710 [bacterium]|nr:hypothetical protein [bacterium]
MAKKLFIIGFGTPILRDVTLKLRHNGAQVVYWQGYRDYFKTIARDRANFPDTIFHYSTDAQRNIPPKSVDVSDFAPPSRELIMRLLPYQNTALHLISRIDYSGWPVPRQLDLYYRYIAFYEGMLERYAPDAILFPDIPHGGDHYVLYALAKLRSIPVVIMEQICVESRTVLINDYVTSSLAIRDYYIAHRDDAYGEQDLSQDLRAYYRRHIHLRGDVTPEYQKHASRSLEPFRTPTPRSIMRHTIKGSLFPVMYSYLRMLWMKNEEETLDAPMRGIQYKRIIRKRTRASRELRKYYESLAKGAELSKKFVYLPLAYQPERTTCPQAGVFDDQLLMVETVAKALPVGWKLYVKENPNQLRPANTFSHLYRCQEYYERIAGLPNVRLIPTEVSTYKLIDGAKAIATATGAAGLEGLLRGKPALVFGSVWYMYSDGVYRVHDVASCRDALKRIANGYAPGRQRVLNYLIALDRNSVRARHFRALHYDRKNYTKDNYISHEDNVKQLTKALLEEIKI